MNKTTATTLIDRLFEQGVSRHVFPNGLTLVHQPDFSSAVVSVQVWVKTGSIHEGAWIGAGLSHFLEHMLFKGTERRDYRAISREGHALGAEMNAYTTFERTVYHIDAPSAVFAKIVDLISDCVLHSTLPTEEFESERDVILREIDMDLDDPDRKLIQLLLQTAYRKHPYRNPVIGHRDLYETITRDDLWAYYTARYVPNNMVVSVVGAVEYDECQREIEAGFGNVPRGCQTPVYVPKEPLQLAPRRKEVIGNYGIARGVIGFKVPHLSHPDAPALDLLAYALGVGESSFLWERLRNQQRRVHYVDCRNWNSGDCGLFELSYVCDPEKYPEVESAIFEIVRDVCDSDFAEAILKKVNRLALNDEINRRKTMSGQASQLGFGEVVIGDINYSRRYFHRLQSVTSQELKAVATHYLIETQMTSVAIVPKLQTDALYAASLHKASQPEPHELIEFASGARLLLQTDTRLPKVHIRCVMRGGPFYELPVQRGISELLAELLTKDTARRSAVEISTLIDCIGGSFSADSGNNTINLATEVLSADLAVALELLGDALTCPAFVEDTFRTELESQIAGLKEEDDEIFDYGLRKLRTHFFTDHPFSVGSGGRIEDLESLTRDDVAAHFRRLVTASNLVVSVVGDFEREAVLEQLQPLLESKMQTASFEADARPAYAGPKSAVIHSELLDREQAVLFQAYPDVGICDEQYVVGELLSELFNGMSSRLFERVREEKGLAYYVGAMRMLGLNTGMFTFYAGTHPRYVKAVTAEINLEIARVISGQVTEEELTRCRTRLLAARQMNQQTLEARALRAALNLTYGLPINDDADYLKKLDKVTPQAIVHFAEQIFDNANNVRLVVGPY